MMLCFVLQRFSDELGISFLEASAKNCASVDDIFQLLVERILSVHHDANSSIQSSCPAGTLSAPGFGLKKPQKAKGCCS